MAEGEVRIWIEHDRPTEWSEGLGKDVPKTKGGRTIVKLLGETDEDVRSIGLANCSELDNYNRRLGTTIALGRAQKLLRDQAGHGLNEANLWELATEMARGKGRNGEG